jgi:hypothetical protein
LTGWRGSAAAAVTIHVIRKLLVGKRERRRGRHAGEEGAETWKKGQDDGVELLRGPERGSEEGFDDRRAVLRAS